MYAGTVPRHVIVLSAAVIVSGALVTVNSRSAAPGHRLASPAWAAAMPQVPAAMILTVAVVLASPPTLVEVAPDRVHTLEVRLTSTTWPAAGPPVTVTAKGALPKARSVISGNVIGWKARCTSKDRVASAAARVLASPAWVARNVQVPTASGVTFTVVRASPSTRVDVAPDTVHTLVVVLDTTTAAVDRPPVTVTGIGASP